MNTYLIQKVIEDLVNYSDDETIISCIEKLEQAIEHDSNTIRKDTSVSIGTNTSELSKIQDVLNNFPSVYAFDIIFNGSNGIGSTIQVQFPHSSNGVSGTFITTITDYRNW